MLPQVAGAAREPVLEIERAVTGIKSDIAISKVQFIKRGEDIGGTDLITIKVEIENNIFKSSTGPFKVRIEWTENPTLGFNHLGDGEVVNLSNPNDGHWASEALTLGPPKILNFSHEVPAGKSYQYRVTADYLYQVDESNEGNNIKSAGYINR